MTVGWISSIQHSIYNIHPQIQHLSSIWLSWVYDCWMNIKYSAFNIKYSSSNSIFILNMIIIGVWLLDEYQVIKIHYLIVKFNIYPQCDYPRCMTVGWIFKRLRSHPTLELLTSFAVSPSLAVFMIQIIILRWWWQLSMHTILHTFYRWEYERGCAENPTSMGTILSYSLCVEFIATLLFAWWKVLNE